METLVLADTHFDHPNVLLYNGRPVLQHGDVGPDGKFVNYEIKMLRTEEMNQYLVDRWNASVSKKDRVIIIGDFAFKHHARHANRLNGKKILILGSHDSASRQVYDNCFTEVVNRKVMKINGAYFDMNHCCQRVWERSHYGSIHLFGHSHGRLNTFNLSFDTGVDVSGNDYRPQNIEVYIERAKVRVEEMRAVGRIIEEKGNDGRIKIMYHQDDLAAFTNNARNGTR